MNTILLVDDIKAVREQFAYDLQRKSGFEILTAADGREALLMLEAKEIDAVILDLEMPVMDGLEMLEVMSKEGPEDVPVIVYTAMGNFQRCVKAVKLGAYNFFDKQEVSLDQLVRAVENALEHRQVILENRRLRRAARIDSPIIGRSPAIMQLKEQIQKVAQVPSNVLIVGESGSGKELVARELHRLSPRAKLAFVAVNCAAIPENLVESELFGFEKGAFSGAVRASRGKFEIANNGTLFLDEIGDMPGPVQAKLLRVLQENEISRLGGESRVIKIDTRVVAATHHDVDELISAGGFRQDLYFRICAHVIKVPALRERLEDIKLLSDFFIERICERFGLSKKRFTESTLAVLQSYRWQKNNVRELENIIERMIIHCDGDLLLPEHIPAEIRMQTEGVQKPATTAMGKTYQELKEDAERQILLNALQESDWHITNTAKALGIANHSNLLKMMRRLSIKKP
jgi:DNA-binding NtrC family response regulator